MDQHSKPVAELTELSQLYKKILNEGPATEETRVYNNIVQEVDFREGQFVVARVSEDYDLTEDEIRILERAPHTNVPIGKAADIIDACLKNKDWIERAKSAQKAEQESDYTWYNITQGYLNGESLGYVASTTRYPVQAELPFIFRQSVAKAEISPDPKMPNLNRDLWTITENRPEVENIASRFCDQFESISDGVIEVDLEGQKSIRGFKNGYVLDHISSNKLLNCIDIGIDDVGVSEIRERLCKLESDPIYQSLMNESKSEGLNKQSISYDKGSEGNIRLTVSFAGVFDNSYDSVSLSNKEHL
ncbi:hypothetical protein GOC83_07520 [Haloarcula rubripromontorii]|uniref:Uncharacterized protein n=1 Tax=Haloarcula rubripromontorii TaxID=1705562 RepID=A0A847U0G1_9EURY|nr:hypothetical protein [Haloarcula rubripromontorii]NLV05977.1 hypothetical protein [Haloarcula rubripromontorii]